MVRPVRASIPRDRLAQVQDRPRDAGPRGQFRGGDVLGRRGARRRPGVARRPPCRHRTRHGAWRRGPPALSTLPARVARQALLERPADAAFYVVRLHAALFHDPLGEGARRPRRRSGRSAAPGPAAGCSTAAARTPLPRGWGRRTRAGWGGGSSAASACRARGGRGLRPCRSSTRGGEVQGEPVAGRLVGIDAAAAGLVGQQAADGQGVVADESRRRAGTATGGRRGGCTGRAPSPTPSARSTAGRSPLVTSRRTHVLDVPAALLELDREPVEQLRVRRPLALGAKVVEHLAQALAEVELPEAVDEDAGGERVVPRNEPPGEVQPRRSAVFAVL